MTRPRSDRRRGLLLPLAALASMLAAWTIAAALGPWPDYLFPSPLAVVASLVELAAGGQLAYNLAATLRRLLLGFGSALGLGLVLAFLMARLPSLNLALKPYLLGLQSLPGLAWIPLSLLWFGYSEATLLFVTVMGSIWAVSIAFADGLATVPPLYFRAARNMGASGMALVTHVGIPAALPVLVGGAKQAWAFAWRSLVGAEIVFAAIGIGFLLNQGREFLDTPQVIAMMLVTLAVGVTFEVLLFSRLERAIRRRWGLAA